MTLRRAVKERAGLSGVEILRDGERRFDPDRSQV